MTVDHPVDRYLLADWGAYCRRENQSGLGFAQVQYKELVARSTSATGWNPKVDPDILRFHRIVTERMAPEARRVLVCRWVYQWPEKKTASDMKISRSHVNRMLHLVILPQLRMEWDRSVESKPAFTP